MEGIDFSFEKDLFGKRNDIEDDTVIFQIYSDENLDEIYIGRVKSSQKNHVFYAKDFWTRVMTRVIHAVMTY